MNYPKNLVSVVLPTHNRTILLKKSIESVLSQSYKNFELIVVNDASTDDTEKVLDEYRKQDERVRIVNNIENIGFVPSLNKGISQVRGKYIARLDDDDFWGDSHKLEKQINFLEKNSDYVLVGCGFIKVDERGSTVGKYILPESDAKIRQVMLLMCPFVHSGAVFTKEAFYQVGGYDEKFHFSQDWDLWARLGKVGKMWNIQDHSVSILQGAQNRSNKKMGYHLRLCLKIREKYRKDYPNFWKGYIIGWISYLFSFIPIRYRVHPVFIKIKKLFLK